MRLGVVDTEGWVLFAHADKAQVRQLMKDSGFYLTCWGWKAPDRKGVIGTWGMKGVTR